MLSKDFFTRKREGKGKGGKGDLKLKKKAWDLKVFASNNAFAFVFFVLVRALNDVVLLHSWKYGQFEFLDP